MPKIKLTDSTKKFIDTLGCEDLSKITFTEDAFEYEDEHISNELAEHIKLRLKAVGDRIIAINEQLKAEHPEYFE
jgi:hypothetical protein